MTGRENRLEKQPIDGLVRVFQRGQIDLPVPAGEQLVVGARAFEEVVGEKSPAFAARL